jgi:hypothetical protein
VEPVCQPVFRAVKVHGQWRQLHVM